MNVCFITRSMPFGKFEAFVIPEVLYAKKAGHCVTVVPLRAEGEVIHQDSVEILNHTIKRPLLSPAIVGAAIQETVKQPIAVLKLLRKIFRSRNTTILLQNMAVFPKALWLARYYRSTVIPDHIHAYWISTAATIAMITATILQIPWSVTAHRGDIAMNNLIAEKVADCCFVRCINENGANEIRQLSGEIDKIRVLHLGVDIPESSPNLGRMRQPEKPFHVLMPGNFAAVKGHVYLIQAIKIIINNGGNLHLDLAGEGELRQSIQQQVDSLQLTEHVSFLGELSHSSLLAQLWAGQWDCVVLPSIVTADGAKEGIPVSLMESMAAGVPVVATATGGIPELCSDGTALLVPEQDPLALAEALNTVMNDTEKCVRMAILAQIRVQEEFNIKTIGPRLLDMMT